MKNYKDLTHLIIILAVFLLCYFLPVESLPSLGVLTEALYLVRWYAREHVLLCLVPAFFIAGGIAVFVSKNSVMKYLGAKANKLLAYSVASVSGTILAVCSCTILPLFAGIYRMGAGLGPASAFLYAGPAINVLAIILTARILGLEIGIARAVGAILFSVIIGLFMALIFRKEETAKAEIQAAELPPEKMRPLWQTMIFFALMIGILVFANWGQPKENIGIWNSIYNIKWWLTGLMAVGLGLVLAFWYNVRRFHLFLGGIAPLILALIFPDNPLWAFAAGVAALVIVLSQSKGEPSDWLASTWDLAKQILPLLLIGVLFAGIFLGRPEGAGGLVPQAWIASALGGNSLWANFFASFAGALMYFATLTEVPILQGLMAGGMGQGPALALLLAGPALSLPSMLVIRSVIGTKKMLVFVGLVVIMGTITGLIYGALI